MKAPASRNKPLPQRKLQPQLEIVPEAMPQSQERVTYDEDEIS